MGRMLWAPSFQGPRFFFCCLSIFPPRGGCRIYQTGGGGADPSIGPRALETLGTPQTVAIQVISVFYIFITDVHSCVKVCTVEEMFPPRSEPHYNYLQAYYASMLATYYVKHDVSISATINVMSSKELCCKSLEYTKTPIYTQQ